MKSRTISQRNLLGALVGGMLGILAFGYLDNAFWLVVGTFAGVISGWWYQEIGAMTANGFSRGIAWRPTSENSPHPLARWMRERPINQAILLRGFACGIFAVIIMYGSLAAAEHFRGVAEEGTTLTAGVLILFLAPVCVTVMCIASISGMLSDGSRGRVSHLYKTWKNYRKMGSLSFIAHELSQLFKMLAHTILTAVTILTFVLGAFGFCILVLTVASTAVAFVKGVYYASIQAGHWLCFGVTLTATAIFATYFYDSFSDTRVLWAVALLSGVVSAVATEGLRRSFAFMFRTNRSTRAIALVSIEKQLKPDKWLQIALNGTASRVLKLTGGNPLVYA